MKYSDELSKNFMTGMKGKEEVKSCTVNIVLGFRT
jgi:hypothetical protein